MPKGKAKFEGFETALARLDEITNLLESGEVKLEESIALYTEGVELAAFCHKKLSEAEGKITVLKEQNQRLTELPVSEEDENGD